MMTSFSPAVGQEGAQVTIRGANFTVGIPVKFNGIAASLVSVVSPTELAVTVPSGATTGYITVGEGVGSTVSTTAFVVGDFSLFPDGGNLAFASKMLGSELVKSCYSSGGLMSGPTLDFSIDSPSPDFTVCSVFWDTSTEYGSTTSIPLNAGLVDERYFVKIRFAPTSTGLKTAVLTLASGGMEIGKYTLTGTGTGLAQPTYFAGYGQNGQAALYWGTDPSYDLVLLGKEGSSVTDAPSALGSYTGNSSFGSGTPVGSTTTIFSGLDSSVSNTVVTGLRNNQFYYFKIFNRNPSANVVSAGKEIRFMPYADITSGVITKWNFNNSDLSPSTGVGAVGAVGGVTAGFVNGEAGSSDRATEREGSQRSVYRPPVCGEHGRQKRHPGLLGCRRQRIGLQIHEVPVHLGFDGRHAHLGGLRALPDRFPGGDAPGWTVPRGSIGFCPVTEIG
ncbi:MAG: hypothetical protein EBZ78_12300 [Verrucomicrobia bacterium]|nr:hypothetical protein [Verrucomicrobiota bacterium]